jgi:hypothetical protein
MGVLEDGRNGMKGLEWEGEEKDGKGRRGEERRGKGRVEKSGKEGKG